MEEKRNYCVYKHTCPNGKVYIGLTGRNPNKRWGNGKGYEKCVYFNQAIKKFGWGNIRHDILLTDLTSKEARSKETYFISYYRSNEKEFGYNLTSGGELNIPNNEARKHMGDAQRRRLSNPENHPMFGKNPYNFMTPESIRARKEKIVQYYNNHTAWNKGLPISECQKEKLRDGNIHYIEENGAFWQGKHRSEETKEKLRSTHIGKYHSEEARKKIRESESIKVICLTTNEIYSSAKYAGTTLGIDSSTISKCCRGNKKSAGKSNDGEELRWMYYKSYLENGKPNTGYYKKETCNNCPIICLNTFEVFKSITNAQGIYGYAHISDACSGKRTHAGKLPDGTPLRWMYYDEYIKLSDQEKEELHNKYRVKEAS